MSIFSFKKVGSCLSFILIVLTICTATGFATLQPVLAVGPCYVTGAPSGPCFDQVTGKASLVQNTITARATAKLNIKETLDGLAWAVAKQMVSSLTQSMVEWINSGFQGSPAFVTDLGGFLKDALDNAAGEYIKSLGGIGEFICSPFKLDVQAALQVNYQNAQSGVPSGANSCKLTGIEDNIKNFLGGTTQDWGQWVQVSSNPQNTPYGAYLEAESKLNVHLKNEAGKQLTLLDWASGWKSLQVCEGPNGIVSHKTPCPPGTHAKTTTPGDVIAQQINYQLHTGTEALVNADEINEIIGALINQLALQAMKGVNGLLGLGGNSAYTDYSYGNGSNTTSYIQSAVTQETILNVALMQSQIGTSTQTEAAYLTLANNSIAVANIKLNVLREAQNTLTNLLNTSTSSTLGITETSTYTEAQSRVNTASAAGTLPLSVLAEVQTQLTSVYDSFAVIKAVSGGVTENTDLLNAPFVTIRTENINAQATLTNFINTTSALIPQIQTTLTSLQKINAVFVNASSTASTTPQISDYVMQKAMTDYVTLIQSGAVISDTGLEAKRTEWNNILN